MAAAPAATHRKQDPKGQGVRHTAAALALRMTASLSASLMRLRTWRVGASNIQCGEGACGERSVPVQKLCNDSSPILASFYACQRQQHIS